MTTFIRFKKSMENMKKGASDILKNTTGKIKDKTDTALGIYIHKNIGTLFFWDKHMMEYEKEFIRCAKAGKKDQALKWSNKMKQRAVWLANNDRRAQKKLKEMGEVLSSKTELMKAKFSKLGESKFLKWVKGGGADSDNSDDGKGFSSHKAKQRPDKR